MISYYQHRLRLGQAKVYGGNVQNVEMSGKHQFLIVKLVKDVQSVARLSKDLKKRKIL